MKSSWKYKVLLAVVKVSSLLPLWFFYFLSDMAYLIGCRVVGYRRKIVTNNLKNAFPEKTDKEIAQIRNKFYRNFCDWLVESIKGHTMRTSNFMKRVKVTGGMEIIHDMIAQKKSIISMNAHFFNWEWLCVMTKYYPKEYQMFTVYQPAKNVEFSDVQNCLRGRFGCITIPMARTLTAIAHNHKQNNLAIHYFFADQSPPANNPFWTTFLNQETSFFLGGEKVASKYDYGVVYLDMYKPRRGYYEVSFKLISDNAKASKQYEITRAYVKLLEEHIHKHPENWLWSHRRWKRKRPEDISLV